MAKKEDEMYNIKWDDSYHPPVTTVLPKSQIHTFGNMNLL